MIRSMNQLLSDFGSVVLSGQHAIGNAFQVIDTDNGGSILDDTTKTKIDTACQNLVHFCRYEANREHDCQIARELHNLPNLGEYGQVDLPK